MSPGVTCIADFVCTASQPRLGFETCILSVKGRRCDAGYRLGLDRTFYNEFEDAEWESL